MFKKQRPRTWRVIGWTGACSSGVFMWFDCNLEEELSHRGAWVEGGRLWLWSACHYQDLSLSVFPRSLCLTLLPSTLCLAPPVCGCSATAARRCQNISGRATRHTHTHTHTQSSALCIYISNVMLKDVLEGLRDVHLQGNLTVYGWTIVRAQLHVSTPTYLQCVYCHGRSLANVHMLFIHRCTPSRQVHFPHTPHLHLHLLHWFDNHCVISVLNDSFSKCRGHQGRDIFPLITASRYRRKALSTSLPLLIALYRWPWHILAFAPTHLACECVHVSNKRIRDSKRCWRETAPLIKEMPIMSTLTAHMWTKTLTRGQKFQVMTFSQGEFRMWRELVFFFRPWIRISEHGTSEPREKSASPHGILTFSHMTKTCTWQKHVKKKNV